LNAILSAPERSVRAVPNADSTRGQLLHRIELRARDYLAGEIGPSKWIRRGRLMGLVEAGAIRGYWPAQMVQRAGDAAWLRSSPRRIVKMLVNAAAAERRSHSL
jgi:hypothetical protein